MYVDTYVAQEGLLVPPGASPHSSVAWLQHSVLTSAATLVSAATRHSQQMVNLIPLTQRQRLHETLVQLVRPPVHESLFSGLKVTKEDIWPANQKPTKLPRKVAGGNHWWSHRLVTQLVAVPVREVGNSQL